MKWFASIALCLMVSAVDGISQTLVLRGSIALPGVKGRFDHFAVDPKGQRIFVAALGNDTVEVIDIAGQKKSEASVEYENQRALCFCRAEMRLRWRPGEREC